MPYVIMKNMVMIGAMLSKSPNRIASWASTDVTKIARRGSWFLPLPLAKRVKVRITQSSAKACRIRGASIMLPSADDSVAAKMPAVINLGDRPIFFNDQVITD